MAFCQALWFFVHYLIRQCTLKDRLSCTRSVLVMIRWTDTMSVTNKLKTLLYFGHPGVLLQLPNTNNNHSLTHHYMYLYWHTIPFYSKNVC
jgi:hypothetical protein